jgi:cytochrome b involved in lipid metabolism
VPGGRGGPLTVAGQQVHAALRTAPARTALDESARVNAAAGHENLGAVGERRGFLPTADPRLRLPESHRAWDDLAADLPGLHRSLRLRRAVDALPPLSAGPDALPDDALQRAATVLGILAHAYSRVQPLQPVPATPDVLRRPWAEVCRRLGRPQPALSYSDLIVCNWRRDEPDAELTVEGLRLLVPTVDNDEERRFYLTQVEMLARAAPLVPAAVRAQEAVLRDDPEALTTELHRAADCLDVLTAVALPKIDPNPEGSSHVDPVVWAKTVAPLAVPLEPGGPGPSGTSSPLFHLLDVLLGRPEYRSLLGEEARRLRVGYPPHWRAFLTALAAAPVPDYVVRRGSRPLEAALRELVERYVSDGGLLGRHRLKVYGYLELAFKLGRSVTIGGFSGLFRDRTWNEVDGQIAASRAERRTALPPVHRLPLADVVATPPGGPGTIRRVALDLTGSGVRYRPGDRVRVQAENDDRQVGRTLGVLRARADQPVPLTAAWQAALGTSEEAGRLEDVLRVAQLRPVGRPLVEALLAVTGSPALRSVVAGRTESAWELWDLLDMLARDGFDPRRTWQAALAEPEALCRLVPPAEPRVYSAASAQSAVPDQLHLTVGRVEYQTGQVGGANGHHRRGTASFFLTRPPATLPDARGAVAVTFERPVRFRPPADPATPLLLFAGGTGVSPFRGFLQERLSRPGPGPVWLFLSTRTRAELCYRDELRALVDDGRLELRVALTREPAGTAAAVDPATRCGHVADLLADEDDAREVWRLLRAPAEGGAGAGVYVCGNAGFAAAVAEALRSLVLRFDDGPRTPSPGARRLRRMIADGRYVEELYTTHLDPARAPSRLVDVSELVLHNGGPGGLWTAIGDRVYDVGEFVHQHPGGAKLLRGYAGMDATAAYEQVGHHLRPEVAAHLPRYELGAVRQLDLGREWGVALSATGLTTVPLADLHRAWVRVLYLVVEMQNAHANDRTLRQRPTTRGQVALPDAYGLQLALEVHVRFLAEHVGGLTGEPLAELWALTAGVCAPAEDVRRWSALVAEVRDSPAAAAVAGATAALLDRLDRMTRSDGGAAGEVAFEAVCERLHTRDARLLEDLKLAVRGGVGVFEELERDAVRRGAGRLVEAALEPVALLRDYYADVAELVRPVAP